MYAELGKEAVAEHWGGIAEASSELSRFRNGVTEHVPCPLCDHRNDINHRDRGCQKVLFEVVDPATNDRWLVEPERCAPEAGPDANIAIERREHYAQAPNRWRMGDRLRVNVENVHAAFKARKSEAEWDAMGADECRSCAATDRYEGPDWYLGPLPGGEPRLLVLAKWQTCGKFHRSRWYTGPGLRDVSPVTIQEDVYAMML